MLTAELVSSPMHVAVLMILSPPAGEDPRPIPDGSTRSRWRPASKSIPGCAGCPTAGSTPGSAGSGAMSPTTVEPSISATTSSAETLPRDSGSGSVGVGLRLARATTGPFRPDVDGLPDRRPARRPLRVLHQSAPHRHRRVAGMQMIAGSLSPDPSAGDAAPLCLQSHHHRRAHTVTRFGHRTAA